VALPVVAACVAGVADGGVAVAGVAEQQRMVVCAHWSHWRLLGLYSHWRLLGLYSCCPSSPRPF